MKINIKNIEFRESIYPRHKVTIGKVADYADAIENGSKFPPIVVCEIDGKNVLVDGAHRRAAYVILSTHDERYQEIEVLNMGEATEEKAFEEAIRRNSEHGMPFSPDERLRLIQKLQEGGKELKYISGLLHMSPSRIKNVSFGRITYSSTGKAGSYDPASRAAITERRVRDDKTGQLKSSIDAPVWLIEIRERFMKGKLDLNNENVRSEIQKLRDLLDRILKTQEVEVA